MARTRFVAVVVLGWAAVLNAGDKKDKPLASAVVDSGAFGVFVKGQRVVTETFSVQTDEGISTVKSHLQETSAPSSAGQKSELKMTGSGELVSYTWSDGSGSLVVTPNNEFLLEKITTSASSKAAEQPFLMPNTSAILDNNFFTHREVLVWRYLATDCHTESGALKCQQGPVEFGVLVPQDRTSVRVRMELVGREKVTIRGTERELLRLNLKGEAFAWALWVDEKDQFKLMRVLIADDNTEVVRD
ncbi:MAG TPA: hypothetical protein VN310_15970 [Candidatus Dormibacteraeota bacterium]|jgi:hypothetical protein|nr:hypothetical protein [Candidatus Dormibacteraeota bacterium]